MNDEAYTGHMGFYKADISEWELAHMVRSLEEYGYVVRKPSEVDIECALEIEAPNSHSFYEIGVRLDSKINGTPFALLRRFPVELLLDNKSDEFRKEAFPKIMAREIAAYIADRMIPGIAAQVEAKLEPLVPEDRMSLDEIVSFIAEALHTTKHRVDPAHYDKNDKRKQPK